jgi:hypothetical protein
MRYVISGILAAIIGLSFTVAYGFGHQSAQLSQLRHSAQPAQQQIAMLHSEIATLSAQLAGEHRDVLTCADLQGLSLQYLEAVNLYNNGGMIYAQTQQTPVSLPAHCINP